MQSLSSRQFLNDKRVEVAAEWILTATDPISQIAYAICYQNAAEPPPLLHPNMAEIYRQQIAVRCESLQNEDRKAEAAEVFRTLIDHVTLVPDEAELAIVLRGRLAAVLDLRKHKKPRSRGAFRIVR